MDEGLDLLVATGFRKPVCSLTLSDRPSVINALLNYHLIAKVKTELDQFREGLDTFGFFYMVKRDPDIWKPFFVFSVNHLTPGLCDTYTESLSYCALKKSLFQHYRSD